jgi:hypothetical protein
MNPHHFPVLLQFYYTFRECTVNVHVSLPQFLSPQVIFEVIEALEVVEEWPQHCLVEIQKLLNSGLVEENRHAAIVFEDFCYFMGFTVVLRDHTRPSYPDNLYHLPLFSEFKHCWIE